MLRDMGISKSTIYFEVKLVKVIEKYPKTQNIFLAVKFYEALYEIH